MQVRHLKRFYVKISLQYGNFLFMSLIIRYTKVVSSTRRKNEMKNMYKRMLIV